MTEVGTTHVPHDAATMRAAIDLRRGITHVPRDAAAVRAAIDSM